MVGLWSRYRLVAIGSASEFGCFRGVAPVGVMTFIVGRANVSSFKFTSCFQLQVLPNAAAFAVPDSL